MDPAMIDEHFENLDRRLTAVEQIVPAVATREDLRGTIAPLATKEELRAAIEPLATKEELRTAIEPLATKEEPRAAIEPLATKEELRAAREPVATKDGVAELRRHMNVLNESLRSDIHLIAAHVASGRPKGSES